jgi:hypothetical protein
LGATEILATTVLTAEQKEYVNMISVSTELLLAQVNRLLELNASGNTTLAFAMGLFSIHRMLEECVGIIVPRLAAVGLELGVYVEASLAGQEFIGDVHRLKQIILHSVSNCTGAPPGAKPADQSAVGICITQVNKDTPSPVSGLHHHEARPLTDIRIEVYDPLLAYDLDALKQNLPSRTSPTNLGETSPSNGKNSNTLPMAAMLVDLLGGRMSFQPPRASLDMRNCNLDRVQL